MNPVKRFLRFFSRLTARALLRKGECVSKRHCNTTGLASPARLAARRTSISFRWAVQDNSCKMLPPAFQTNVQMELPAVAHSAPVASGELPLIGRCSIRDLRLFLVRVVRKT